MNHRFLGIIDDTIKFSELGDLLLYRTVGAIPFLGHYRLIDFPMSSFHQANVRNVAVYSSGKFRSLQDHISNGEIWDLNRKRDGLFFFPKMSEEHSLILSFLHINDHIEYLLKSTEDYVVITNSYVVGMIDYEKLVKDHIKRKCDITEVYYQDERLNIFILSRRLLIELVLESINFGYNNLIQVIDLSQGYHVEKIALKQDIYLIRSIEDYYQMHLNLLNREQFKKIFSATKPIITNIQDSPSTYFKKGAQAQNSLFSSGIISEGLVENSIVYHSVIIGKNAYIKNSIINEKCIIGANCRIENAILDKECIIAPNVSVKSDGEMPLLLAKHTKIAKYNV